MRGVCSIAYSTGALRELSLSSVHDAMGPMTAARWEVTMLALGWAARAAFESCRAFWFLRARIPSLAYRCRRGAGA